VGAGGTHLGEAGLGNRKDVRDAVEAARKAGAWAKATAHARAQVLYYLAENLAVREDELADRIRAMTGTNGAKAHDEVRLSVERLFAYAAWADKMDGDVHAVPMRAVTLAMKEPWGVVGLACPDEAPLLALVSMAAPLLALGNRVVAVPSPRWPLAAPRSSGSRPATSSRPGRMPAGGSTGSTPRTPTARRGCAGATASRTCGCRTGCEAPGA
jgi:aldehyde dehydrogenase (NAD+)